MPTLIELGSAVFFVAVSGLALLTGASVWKLLVRLGLITGREIRRRQRRDANEVSLRAALLAAGYSEDEAGQGVADLRREDEARKAQGKMGP
jgi:hypothetical protein